MKVAVSAGVEWEVAMFVGDPVLIVSGDEKYCEALVDLVSRYGLLPVCCTTLSAARTLLDRQAFCAVLSEEILPDGYFAMLIHEDRGRRGNPPVVVVSHRDDWDSYLAVMGVGAFEYVHFPPNTGELERCLWLAISEARWSERKAA